MTQRPFTDLVDVFQRSIESFATHNLFGTKTDGQWVWTTYQEFGKRVDNFRGGLASLGIGPGDTVSVISGNRVEWAVAAYAVYGLGARFCPMYESQLAKDWEYINNDSGAKVLLTSTYAIYEAVKDWPGKVGALEKVFCMALPDEDEASFGSLERIGEENPAPTSDVTPETICGFIYTSGTGGSPKGVMQTHRNILSNCMGAYDLLERFGLGDEVFLSFLPLSHSYEHTAGQFFPISIGAQIYYAESAETLLESEIESVTLGRFGRGMTLNLPGGTTMSLADVRRII